MMSPSADIVLCCLQRTIKEIQDNRGSRTRTSNNPSSHQRHNRKIRTVMKRHNINTPTKPDSQEPKSLNTSWTKVRRHLRDTM
uniref:Uncharacterized protein n=1 Tax=Nothobranchius kadleci TaxID=1051664 RepID=A0A1A8D946_NOTKA